MVQRALNVCQRRWADLKMGPGFRRGDSRWIRASLRQVSDICLIVTTTTYGSVPAAAKKLIPAPQTSRILPPSLPRRTDCSEHLRGEPVGLGRSRARLLIGSPCDERSRGAETGRRNPASRGGDVSIHSTLLRRTRLGIRPVHNRKPPGDPARGRVPLSGKTRWPQHPPQRFRLLRTVPYGTPANGKVPRRSVPFEWERFPWPWPSRSTKRRSLRASRLC